MRRTLEEIWIRSSVPGHVITYEETFAWPKAERDVVFGLGLLRRVEDAEWVECDACGEAHGEDVVFLDEDGSYPVILCPVVGLVRVSPERLQRWEVDFDVVVKLLAAAFGLTGTPQELKPGRVWLLGSRRLAGRLAEFFLVQGADWPDGPELLSSTPRLQNSPAPVVLFPSRLPAEPAWQANGRALYSLRELVRLGESGLAARLEPLEDLYRQIALRLEEPIAPTPVGRRGALLKEYCSRKSCTLKQICWWAMIHRQDLNAWKLGKPEVPDGGEKATRIERLLQLDLKART
ncbi:MAG: hypothetical protein ACOYX1_02595 [Acidobacteriota bacterium]